MDMKLHAMCLMEYGVSMTKNFQVILTNQINNGGMEEITEIKKLCFGLHNAYSSSI